jgi:hypothetical protein
MILIVNQDSTRRQRDCLLKSNSNGLNSLEREVQISFWIAFGRQPRTASKFLLIATNRPNEIINRLSLGTLSMMRLRRTGRGPLKSRVEARG